MKKYLLLVFVTILFVGCTPTTEPVESPSVNQSNEVNETIEVESNEEVGKMNQVEKEDSETNEVDDTTDLFGEEAEIDVSL